MLTAGAAEELARAYDLGAGARLAGPRARGQLGQVWMLETERGRYAVKEWFAPPDLVDVEARSQFAERARRHGVCTPRAHRDAGGASC